jgi:methionyl-tRNA formyltransferase
MKLIIAGKNSIAVDVLKYVLEIKADDVYVVLNKTETFSNGFQKSLGFYARLWNVPIIELNDAQKLENAIFLSLQFDRIIKPNLFKSNQLFNIHFSKLPAYKGMHTSVLPILNGENQSGVTLHLIDKGIDTGNIIEQMIFMLTPEDTARSLYLKFIEKGTELVIRNLEKLLKNEYKSFPQEYTNSTYFSKSSLNYSLDYHKTAFQIDQQFRAFSFREYQLPKYNECKIGSWEIMNNKSSHKPGTLIREDSKVIHIATIDFDMLLYKDFYEELWSYCRHNNLNNLKESKKTN